MLALLADILGLRHLWLLLGNGLIFLALLHGLGLTESVFKLGIVDLIVILVEIGANFFSGVESGSEIT